MTFDPGKLELIPTTGKTKDAVWRFGVLGNDKVTLGIGLNQQEVEHDPKPGSV